MKRERWIAAALTMVLAAFGASDARAGIIATLVNPANGHTYHLLTQNTWTGSQAEAVSLGGNLVTINDAAEQAWVYNSFAKFGGVSRALWIGLTDALIEGSFTWVSGEPVTYTNWSPGEPNNSGNEDFVHMWYPPNLGQWNDLPDISSFSGVAFHGVVEVVSVPEPSALALGCLGLGGLGAAGLRRRFRRRPA